MLMDIKIFLKQLELKNPGAFKKVKKDLSFQIGREVERNRVKVGWTQAQLAKKIKTHQPGIARLERGTSLPSLRFLEKVAAALGAYIEFRFVSLEDIVVNYGTHQNVPTEGRSVLSMIQMKDLNRTSQRTTETYSN